MHKTLLRLAALQDFKPIQIKDKLFLTDEYIVNTDSIYTDNLKNHSAWLNQEGYLSWGSVILIPIETIEEIQEALMWFLPVTPTGSDTDETVDELLHIIKTAPSHVIDSYLSWVSQFKKYPNLQESLNFFYETSFSEMPF